MCMMSVGYTNDDGDETVVENVVQLIQNPEGIQLFSLLNAPVFLPGKWWVTADFEKGMTQVSPENTA